MLVEASGNLFSQGVLVTPTPCCEKLGGEAVKARSLINSLVFSNCRQNRQEKKRKKGTKPRETMVYYYRNFLFITEKKEISRPRSQAKSERFFTSKEIEKNSLGMRVTESSPMGRE